ncbi:MAG: hypothetical protein WBA57_00355 [Elainellaceae cyanobacterium]
MNYPSSSGNANFPAPCIVDTGTLVNKRDMRRILADLGQVRYIYSQDGQVISQGEGYVLDVFADSQQSTLVANHSLYLNVYSFDCLELGRSDDHKAACFKLVQDNRILSLIPLSDPLKGQGDRPMDSAALEAMVAEVLSASIDMRLDDDENFD